MKFSLQRLQEIIQKVPDVQRLCVAYSGGMDSHALLYALHQLRDSLPVPVRAVYVDHGLQDQSGSWSDHCRSECQRLNITFTGLEIAVAVPPGASPEAAARNARYGALQDYLREGDCLLTGHHQDDQAETVLLQMLRGCGVHGLAAMPALTKMGRARHLRPLLSFSRKSLREYAQKERLDWIEDPSNQLTDFDRNYIRHKVSPVLARRYPSSTATLARVASLQSEAADLLEDMGAADLELVEQANPCGLIISELLQLGGNRRRNVIRCWLRKCGVPIPSQVVLHRVEKDILAARPDANPVVCWRGAEARRYRDTLFVRSPLPAHDKRMHFHWNLEEPLAINTAGGVLRAVPTRSDGLRQKILGGGLDVCFRHGGERCQPAGRQHRHKLKHLFQERGIPPWARDRLPLLYVDGELAAVAGLWVCQPFVANPGEEGVRIQWQAAESL